MILRIRSMRYDTRRSAWSTYQSVVPNSLRFFQVDDRLGLVTQWLQKSLQVDGRLGITGTGTGMANFIGTGTAISNGAIRQGELFNACAQ